MIGNEKGKKKARRLAEKEDKRNQREFLLQQREEREKKEEERRQKELEEKQVEAEAERIRQEEEKERKRKQEEEEEKIYQNMKKNFKLQSSGNVEDENSLENPDLLNEFIDYVKKTKVVVLEEVATKFMIPTQEIIDRLTTLEKMGRISGLMDDRGKFIYVSPEEMKAVVNYINLQGRISIADLTQKIPELIHLT